MQKGDLKVFFQVKIFSALFLTDFSQVDPRHRVTFVLTSHHLLFGSQSGARRGWIYGGRLEGFGSENLQTCWRPATGDASDGVRLVNLNGSPRQDSPGRDNTETTELLPQRPESDIEKLQPGTVDQLGRMKPLAGWMIRRLIPACDLGFQRSRCIPLRSLSPQLARN